jgi:hypothetical protein
LERAQRGLQAHQDAPAAVPENAPADAMLDFYGVLSAAVRRRMEGADSLARVNARSGICSTDSCSTRCPMAWRSGRSSASAPRSASSPTWSWQPGVLAHIVGSEPVPVHVGENDDELLMTLPARPFDSAGELERHLLMPGAEVEIGFEVRNPPAVIATGDERIVPPMRSIEAPASELASTQVSEKPGGNAKPLQPARRISRPKCVPDGEGDVSAGQVCREAVRGYFSGETLQTATIDDDDGGAGRCVSMRPVMPGTLPSCARRWPSRRSRAA